MGRCESLGSLKSFLSYASWLGPAPCIFKETFFCLEFPQGLLAHTGVLELLMTLTSLSSSCRQWGRWSASLGNSRGRAGITDSCGVLAYRHGRRHPMSQCGSARVPQRCPAPGGVAPSARSSRCHPFPSPPSIASSILRPYTEAQRQAWPWFGSQTPLRTWGRMLVVLFSNSGGLGPPRIGTISGCLWTQNKNPQIWQSL